MTAHEISEVEKTIGYTFNDKSLLVTAMTHASYSNEHVGSPSYDKLEFFGDSILNFIVAENLFMSAINDEGEMTVKRAKIVSRKPLHDAVCKMDLFQYVRFGKGVTNSESFSQKAKSDIFESLLAAIYIDSNCNMNEARRFIDEHLRLSISQVVTDYKSKLQEYAQARKIPLVYLKAEQSGEKYHPSFSAEAVLGGDIRGVGEGSSIKEAQQNAAREILEKINEV